jgi:hypothetical protein
MPMQQTQRSTSHEPIDGVVLEVWEQGPCSKLDVLLVINQ